MATTADKTLPPSYDSASSERQETDRQDACNHNAALSYAQKKNLVVGLFQRFAELESQQKQRLKQLKAVRRAEKQSISKDIDEACKAIETYMVVSRLRSSFRHVGAGWVIGRYIGKHDRETKQMVWAIKQEFKIEVESLLSKYSMLGKTWIHVAQAYICTY